MGIQLQNGMLRQIAQQFPKQHSLNFRNGIRCMRWACVDPNGGAIAVLNAGLCNPG